MNLEYNVEEARVEGEGTGSYYNRLWSRLDLTGGFVTLGSDSNQFSPRTLAIAKRGVFPGGLYEDCSEFLHGRGSISTACSFEASELLAPTHESTPLVAARTVLDILELCLERLATCASAALAEQGQGTAALRVHNVARVVEPAGEASYPRWGFWPLVPATGLNPAVYQQVSAARHIVEAIFRGERIEGRLLDDGEVSAAFFMASRGRAVDVALASFRAEVEMLGNEWDVKGLYARENGMVFVSEILALVARWDDRKASSRAAAFASSGLRSAFWLWLEDDDRAMGVLRAVLEAVATLETYLRKPEKAARLEARGNATTPRDWIEAAGWRRLKALNFALGDFAHTREGSRWVGSRDLLATLLDPTVDPVRAPHQGRGFALTAIVALAARTAVSAVHARSEELGRAVQELFQSTHLFDEDVERLLNEWLDRAWSERDFDFGDPIFTADPRAAEASRRAE